MFKTVAEAFNFYRTKSIEEMQTRAAAISAEIDSNADVDIEALNVELKGIKEARDNAETRSEAKKTLNFFEASNMTPQKSAFEAETVLDTEEYRSAFYKTLLNQRLTDAESRAFDTARVQLEKRADAFNASTDPGTAAVLPTTTLNEIIKKARTIGGLLGECRAFNMPTKISIPVGTPSSKAAWHTEGKAVTSEKVTTAAVTFDGFEIMKVFSLSVKTKTMSVAAFESYLVEELTACVMECIADSLINGTGSEQGTGLDKGVTWNAENSVKVVAKDIAYGDVVNAVALLKRGYSQGAKWAMNNATLYKVFYGMLDGSKRPIFISDPKSESTVFLSLPAFSVFAFGQVLPIWSHLHD